MASAFVQAPVLGKVKAVYEYNLKKDGTPDGTVDTQKLHRRLQELIPNSTIVCTGKYDGTCAYIHNGVLYARQDVKADRKKPDGWFPTAGDEPDANGHFIGFRPITKGDKWFIEALNADRSMIRVWKHFRTEANPDGWFVETWQPIGTLNGFTVELIGPKINKNVHGVPEYKHGVIIHGSVRIADTDCDWGSAESVKRYLLEHPIGRQQEGIVLHVSNSDGSELFKLHRGHLMIDKTIQPSSFFKIVE